MGGCAYPSYRGADHTGVAYDDPGGEMDGGGIGGDGAFNNDALTAVGCQGAGKLVVRESEIDR